MSAIERSNERKIKKNFFYQFIYPPPLFTLFNATAAFLSFVSAAIIPNRRSKGRDATSIITLTYMAISIVYRNTLNMANRDLNRLKSCAGREKTD